MDSRRRFNDTLTGTITDLETRPDRPARLSTYIHPNGTRLATTSDALSVAFGRAVLDEHRRSEAA